MAKILLVIEGEKEATLDETGFAFEGKLQDYLEKYPSLIPIEDIDENAAPLLCIGREVGVASGAVDLLFIGRDGVLTVAETKLADSREVRRTVVGQIIEYASYIYSWTADDVYAVANAYLREKDLDEAMRNNGFLDSWWEEDQESYNKLRKECDAYRADMIIALKAQNPELYTKLCDGAGEDEFSGEDFRNNIEQNLRNGKIRLLIAVDKLVEPLRATVTFLNDNSNFDIFLLQIKNFEESESRKVLIPTLFGYAKPPTRGKGVRHQWTEEEFLGDVAEKCEKEVAETIRKLLEFTKNNAARTFWGTGAYTGSFTFHKFNKKKQSVSIFTAYSDGGRLWLNFGWMWDRVDKEALEIFKATLNQISGINIPEDAVSSGRFPSIDVKALAQGDSLQRFEEAVLSLCNKIEAGE